ncbi:MAG: hypothetical protein ACREID_09590, partial [Planctomycetota bacterium]
PGRTIQFSNYFDANYEGTFESFVDPDPLNPPALSRRKYPFTADQYANAFFLPYDPSVHLTPLRFHVIAQGVDRRGTSTRNDDIITRKAFTVQVRIPDIRIDTAFLPDGQAGVDYIEFVAASGGVPPLQFDLEWVDNTNDLAATSPNALNKTLFGLEMNTNTAQFFGVPRASATGGEFVELTVRVFAAVMNPITQNTDVFVPTGGDGEFNGQHPVTGKRGIHKSFPVHFTPPTIPILTNFGLAAGVDGAAYAGDQLVGAGGVPYLVPEPVGFTGTYPTSTAVRSYEWSATYIRDASYEDTEPASVGLPDPVRALPRDLVLDGDPLSPTNGSIFGECLDRGFHPVTVTQRDHYLGAAAAPSAGNAQALLTNLALSISPDTAVYLRGVQTTENANGVASGILDAVAGMAEPRMVPAFLASGLFSAESGKTPVNFSAIPAAFDILPVLLVHGGDDEHLDKSKPSISGFWPSEANKEVDHSNSATRAWQHFQQEATWIQLPDHKRVFLWGQTRIKKWNDGSATTGGYSKRYQVFDSAGQRGILVVNPVTGEFWVPAILDNGGVNGPAHGTQFGGEVVMQTARSSANDGYYYYEGVGYWKRYYYATPDSTFDREVLSQGLGSYLEAAQSTSANGWNRTTQGRSGVSVAVSADGKWAATAMPGGDGQKILLWKTDKTQIPSAITSQGYVTALTGKDSSGADLPNSACIVNLGGQDFSGTVIPQNQAHLLADSLCFVRDGLIFLNTGNIASLGGSPGSPTYMDRIFGVSLIDGHLSSKQVPSTGGVSIDPNDGMYIPDNDYLRADMAQANFSVQFAFTGKSPLAGEEGPERVAFIAGDNHSLLSFTSDTPAPRDGYIQRGNRNKQLYVLQMSTYAASGQSGLDLDQDAITTLLPNDNRVYGDLLTPGRPGEEQDWCTMSPDGRYVAVVRDNDVVDYVYYTFYGWTTYPTFASIQPNGQANWAPNDDLLLVSVDGEDLDSGATSAQSVLYIGSHSFTPGTTSDPLSPAATGVTGKSYLNAVYRRVSGVRFGANTGNGERSLIFVYAGDNTYTPKDGSYYNQWGINPTASAVGTFGYNVQMSVRVNFKTSAFDLASP